MSDRIDRLSPVIRLMPSIEIWKISCVSARTCSHRSKTSALWRVLVTLPPPSAVVAAWSPAAASSTRRDAARQSTSPPRPRTSPARAPSVSHPCVRAAARRGSSRLPAPGASIPASSPAPAGRPSATRRDSGLAPAIAPPASAVTAPPLGAEPPPHPAPDDVAQLRPHARHLPGDGLAPQALAQRRPLHLRLDQPSSPTSLA